jgi:YVTN family beta-propeller protein
VVAAILAALVGTIVPIVLTRGGGGLEAIGTNAVGQIALGSGTISRSIPVGTGPGGIAYGLGAVWVANATDGTVSRVDPRSGTAVPIRVGNDPTGVAVDPIGRAVWVTNGTDGTVSRIDVATGAVSTIQVGNGPAGVVVGLGGVWVANSLDDTVSFIAGGAAEAAIPVGATPTGITIADHAVWVTDSSDATVSRIDPGPHPLVRSIDVGEGPTGIASGGGGVWVANSYENTVSEIDPSTNNATTKIPVGDGPNGVAIASGSVWVSNEFGASVSRIDPSAKGVAKTVPVGSAPQALAAAGGSLWVSTRGAPTHHRGGTLTVVVTRAALPRSLDPMPGADGDFAVLPLSELTNDGLVGFRHIGGAAGSTVVPDLATSIPAPTDGGREFTFQLRSGITYSDGRPVKAGDVRRGIERLFAVRDPDASSFTNLVGGFSCAHSSECNLSKGIVTNDTTGTVTFHLTRTDSEFLTSLASPDVVVVPKGTPNSDTGQTPLPATGPYMFGAFTPGQSVELDRNPKFHVWSPQATPDGYPDRIVWKVAPGSTSATQTAAALAEVRAGTADVFGVGVGGDSPTPDQLQKIQTAVPAQVHDYLDLGTFYFTLNTKFPPFNNLSAREAVNFAVNREKALAAYPQSGRVTCQILPPNFLGYRPFCPYTLDPNNAGTWKFPDLSKATRLVNESGTHRTLIRMAEWQPFGDVAKHVKSVLISLGYRVSLKIIPGGFGNFFGYMNDPNNRVSMAGFWDLSFSTSPAGWFSSGITCGGPDNFSGFCDPKLDTKIEHAIAVQIRDPAASAPLWARIDREATTKAAWLALFTQGGVDFVSKRVGNYQHNPVYGILTDQLWVK